MINKNKIKVLVVDDSVLFREILSRGIQLNSNIEVIATAENPFDARDKIIRYQPDVMICDIEMPKMNGLEFVKRLVPQYYLPIIIVSSVSGVVFDAMEAGAVDFVAKPESTSVYDIQSFLNELISKIKIASVANVSKYRVKIEKEKIESKQTFSNVQIIAIGASTGGIEAIYNVLKALPSNVPGIVIAQHIPPLFSSKFANRMNELTNLKVKEAKTGDCVESGHVLIAPGGQQMIIKKNGSHYKAQCFEGEKVNGHCPSVDVLFESVATVAGKMAIGVILTGMGYDGAKGLLAMRQNEARTIGQDEKTAVVYGMPRVAFNIGAVEVQAPLEEIPKLICAILN